MDRGNRTKWDGEAALVRRAQTGDEQAFQELVGHYQSKVLSIICGILRNRNDAEDIAQQVFVSVYFSIGKFDPDNSLLAWIYRITINQCCDYLRKRKTQKLTYESEFSAEETEALEHSRAVVDPAAPAERQLAQHELVVKLLSMISGDDRALLLLKEVEGYTVEELAAWTGLNESTIKVKLFRTRQKLIKAARGLGLVDPPREARHCSTYAIAV